MDFLINSRIIIWSRWYRLHRSAAAFRFDTKYILATKEASASLLTTKYTQNFSAVERQNIKEVKN